jgi:hypothetical protein
MVASLDNSTCTYILFLEFYRYRLRGSDVLRPPDDGNELLKHVGVNMECINKSDRYLDAFVGYFITILQNAWPSYQDHSNDI